MGIREASIFGTRRDVLVYASIAILFLAAAWLIGRALGAFIPDPDYAYLMNGLNILRFKGSMFYDHPGTPVQTIIAVVLAIAWLAALPWHGLSGVQDQVLLHPQFYMDCINCVFSVWIAGALVFFTWNVRKASGTALPALIGLISIFLTNAVYVSFHRIMPEPVILGATLVLAGLIAQAAFAPNNSWETRRFAVAIGILLGFCVTAKVTSAPVLLTLFFLRSRRAKKTALLAFVISAIAFLLPIFSQWFAAAHTYLHILTHRGNYGAGTAGAPPLSELLANLGVLWSTAPEMFVSLGLFLFVLLGQRILGRPLPGNLMRALLLCAAVVGVGLIMVAKQPHPYYLLPDVAFMCLGNTLVAFLLFRNARFSIWAGVIIFILIAAQAARILYRDAQADAAFVNSNEPVLQQAQQSGCLVVPYYGVNADAQFNLFFGNIFTGGLYGDRLQRLYPNFVAYDSAPKQFRTFTSDLSPDEAIRRFSREQCVYLIGGSWWPDMGIPPGSLALINRSRFGLTLYSLKPGWTRGGQH